MLHALSGWGKEEGEALAARIYLDVDDVVADTISSVGELLFDLHGRRVATEEVVQFDLGVSYGLSDEEVHELLEAAHLDPFIEAIEVIEGAAQVIENWHRSGYTIEFLTGRPPSSRNSTLRWLDRHGFSFSRFDCVDKYGRMKGESKSLELHDLPLGEYVLAIEDNLDMAEFLAKHTPAAILLMDRPWNRNTERWDAETHDRVTRFTHWSEVAEHFPKR